MDCGAMVFDNNPRCTCPKCGGQMAHLWDEQADYERELVERDRYEDEAEEGLDNDQTADEE